MAARALLLDRDGVINVDHGYVHTIDRFDPVPGIFALGRRAHDLGYRLVVVTNQSGIARGLYSEAQYQELTRWMGRRFAAEGAPLAGVLHSPFHTEGVLAEYRRDSFWRKPAPGMLLEASVRLGLDLGASLLIGDHARDLEAARRAGVGKRVFMGVPPADADLTVTGLSDPRLLALL
jgi:D-glycero-D-manno-heptose 1,7-bisphosphate phosphatase